MDHLPVDTPAAIFGETTRDASNERATPDQVLPTSSAASELGISDLIAKYPLLAVTAAGTVALLAVVAMQKGASGGAGVPVCWTNGH